MSTLQVAIVQLASTTDPAENRKRLDVVDQISAGAPPVDLVVLPEAFACDFGPPGTDISELAEPVDGPFVEKLRTLADRDDVTIVAGMFERSPDRDRPYNTLVAVDRAGVRAAYRKIHLYDSFGYRESERLLAGDLEPVVVDIGGFRVGLMTCYDLRFPELARALVRQGAELLAVPSAWVAGPRKVDHWRTLVKARAIENTVYVAAAGQPGPRYAGTSMVVSPFGDVLVELEDADVVAEVSVERSVLRLAREENPALSHRRL